MSKYLLYCIASILIVLAGGLLLQSPLISAPSHVKKTDPTAAVPVTVVEASPMTIFDHLESLGTTVANESAQVSANVSEVVTAIHFEDGQQVQAGDLLVTLQQDEERAQRSAALEQLAEHQRELKRLRTLVQENVIPQRDYDVRLTSLNIARQRLREIEARIRDRTIRAPFNGTLGLRQVSVGALVEPGDLITTIDDISRIKLDFSIPAISLNSLRPGSVIHAYTDSWKDQRFVGDVATIATRIDPDTRSVPIRAVIANHEMRLKPGMLMRVEMITRQRQAIMIPEGAIIPNQRRSYVLHVGENHTAQRKAVVIGQRRPGFVEITDGILAGERIIVRGTTRVRPGQQVSIKKSNPLMPQVG